MVQRFSQCLTVCSISLLGCNWGITVLWACQVEPLVLPGSSCDCAVLCLLRQAVMISRVYHYFLPSMLFCWSLFRDPPAKNHQGTEVAEHLGFAQGWWNVELYKISIAWFGTILNSLGKCVMLRGSNPDWLTQWLSDWFGIGWFGIGWLVWYWLVSYWPFWYWLVWEGQGGYDPDSVIEWVSEWHCRF